MRNRKIRLIIPALLAIVILVSLLIGAVKQVSADDGLSYTVLSDKVQYFQTTFPVGLRYSEGWYGTFAHCVPDTKVLLYDDDKGICIFSTPIGMKPTGEQGGTKLTTLDLKEAQAILQSYSLKESVEVYDAEITDVLESDDYYTGVWSGEKLKQKFKHEANLDEKKREFEDRNREIISTTEVYIPSQPKTLANIDSLSAEEKAVVLERIVLDKPLTQRQIDAKADFKAKREGQAEVDLLKYDPDRYFVMGQTFWTDGTANCSIDGRIVADTAFTVDAAGNFTVKMASGTTGTVSGTNISGTPVTLSAGSNTITTNNSVADGAFDITIGTAANWSSVNSWSAATGGACGASVPTNADSALFDANSFATGSQILTVDTTASCLNMDWTGATNTPGFKLSATLYYYGNVTFISGMTNPDDGANRYFLARGSNSITLTSNTLSFSISLGGADDFTGTLNLADNIVTTRSFNLNSGICITGNKNITCDAFVLALAANKTLTLGTSPGSVITCTSWTYSGSNLTLTANTSTINVSGAGAFAGGNITTYNNINLIGSAHTVSGAFTCNTLSRIGSGGQISTYTITAGGDQGSGYTAGDILVVTQAGGAASKIEVLTVGGSGEVATSRLVRCGTGYTAANDLATTVSPGGGTGCLVNITAVTGTAAKTDTVTFTSGTTVTCGTASFVGNSAVNRLLVQSTTLGTSATIHANSDVAIGWAGTNCSDFMDITSTHAADLSAAGLNPAGFAGDCGGNYRITFTTSAAQNWVGTTSGSWSTAARWTSRVPLPQDDVTFTGITFDSGRTVTVDMPRIGRSVDFSGMSWTGTATTVSMSMNSFSFGNFTQKTGITLSGSYINILGGRVANMPVGGWTVTFNSVTTMYATFIYAPGAIYKYVDAATLRYNIYILAGTLDFNDQAVNVSIYIALGSAIIPKTIYLRSSIITITSTSPDPFRVYYGTVNAGTSTIILSNSSTTAQTFGGISSTYNNVTVQGAGAYALTITGSNTFNTFTVDTTDAAKTLTTYRSTNQTFTNFVHTGTNILTINTDLAGTAATWTKATDSGFINLDYLSLKDNTGAPSATAVRWFYGTHSSVVSGVNGWNTGSVAVPTITTSAASVVEAVTATLNGDVVNLGGAPNTTVTVYYGTSDGGTTPGLWTFAVAPTSPAQPQGVAAFYKNASGLATGTVWYFSAAGTSVYGTGWGTTKQFLTKPAPPTLFSASDGNFTGWVRANWTQSFGATDYHLWRGVTDLGALGNVATTDDATAAAGIVTPGVASVSDGTSTAHVSLSILGAAVANGATYTYTIVASNATGSSISNPTDTGYRGVGALTYEWFRSAGTIDAAYATLGIFVTPHDDTTAPAPSITNGTASATDGTSTTVVTLSLAGESTNIGAVRWYYCTVSSTGTASVDTNHNDGYRSVGTLTYKWQRSAADSDAAYSDIVGATTDPYNDTAGVVDFDGRYYRCLQDATGAVQQISNADRGYLMFLLLAPTNFTVTVVGDDLVFTWVTNPSATSTLVVMDYTQPTLTTDGHIVYSGAGNTFTIVKGYNELTTYYFSAWSYNLAHTVYSIGYAIAQAGGAGMLAIMALIIALGLTAFAFFVKEAASGMLRIASTLAWIIMIPLSFNQNWSSTNTYLPTAAAFLSAVMMIVMLAATIIFYVDWSRQRRAYEPSDEQAQADYRKQIYKTTKKKSDFWNS